MPCAADLALYDKKTTPSGPTVDSALSDGIGRRPVAVAVGVSLTLCPGHPCATRRRMRYQANEPLCL